MADEATTDTTVEGESPATDEAPLEGSEPTDDLDGDKFDSVKALEKIKKLNSEARNLRERAKAAEEKAAGAGESSKQAEALAAENLRLKVGLKHNLPAAIIDRLRGANEEELLADAQALLEVFSPKAPPSDRPKESLSGGTPAAQAASETDLDRLGARMFRH